MNRFLPTLALPVLLTLAGVSKAQDTGSPFLALGYDNGGESSRTIVNTHGGLRLGVGMTYTLPENLELQFGIFYKTDSDEDGSVDVTFTSVPLELLLSTRFRDRQRLSLGVVYSLNNTLEGDVTGGSSFTDEFKDSTGWLLQYDYTFNQGETIPAFRFGLRYTFIDLEQQDGNRKLDGNGLGINVDLVF